MWRIMAAKHKIQREQDFCMKSPGICADKNKELLNCLVQKNGKKMKNINHVSSYIFP